MYRDKIRGSIVNKSLRKMEINITQWTFIFIVICFIMASHLLAKEGDGQHYPCLVDSDCSVLNGSLCSNGTCLCPRGRVRGSKEGRHGSVCQRILAEVNCTTDSDCQNHDSGSMCKIISGDSVEKSCTCQKEFFTSDDGSRCVRRRIGTWCRSDQECQAISNSECLNKMCSCRRDPSVRPGGYIPANSGEECRLRFLESGSCINNEECSSRVVHSICDESRAKGSSTISKSRCICDVGYTEDLESDRCVPKELGDKCVIDDDCAKWDPNSFCKHVKGVGSFCQCNLGYLAKSSSEHTLVSRLGNRRHGLCRKRTLGDMCSFHNDCDEAVGLSACLPCTEEHRNYNECRNACDVNGEGQANDTQASSNCNSTKVCMCLDGYVSAGGFTSCVKNPLHKYCKSDKDCSAIEGKAVCVDANCTCQEGFQGNEGDTQCVEKKLNDTCEGDGDCKGIKNSKCAPDKRCQCKPGFLRQVDSMRCRRRLVGESCSADEDCSSRVLCKGVCTCPIGQMINTAAPYRCLPLRLTSHCEWSKDCDAAVKNSMCSAEKRCVCKKGCREDRGQCQKLKINSTCKKENDGCPTAVAHSKCIAREEGTEAFCTCNEGFFATSNLSVCVLRRLNDKCKSNNDCRAAVANSECGNSSRCICKLGFMATDDDHNCIKRQLNDRCSNDSDCFTTNSTCQDERCKCKTGLEPFRLKCVRKHIPLTEACEFNKQCQRVHNNSKCVKSRCVCTNNTFMNLTKEACLPMPLTVGSACSKNIHCQRKIGNSLCNIDIGGICECKKGHLPSSDGRWCPQEPQFLDDYCDSGIRCSDFINNTVCNSSSCVCQYGYTNKSSTLCKERPRLRHYPVIKREEPVPCVKNDDCRVWTNSTCASRGANNKRSCVCKHKTARRFRGKRCVDVQTYELLLNITHEADIYDYKPLRLGLSEEAQSDFLDRVVLNGVQRLFRRSPLRNQFVSCEVKRISDLRRRSRRDATHYHSGVNVELLLHFTADYLNAVKTEYILTIVLRQLKRSGGTIGRSGLQVASPSEASVNVIDFNECQAAGATDCSPLANCINTVGSYMCVCKPNYVDEDSSLEYSLMGKNCSLPKKAKDKRPNDTKIEIVIIVLVLFTLTIMVFIVYEIVKRKQSFNARALYAKFGTTKIRKLKKASMRRLKERKKRMKEESKKRREENRTKKEGSRKAGVAQKVEKLEKKKMKAEEKKKRKQEIAELKKAKKDKKKEAKNKKNQPVLNDSEISPHSSDAEPVIVIEQSSIDMPMEAVEASGATPGSLGPPDNTFMYYPVASPDPDVVQDWRLQVQNSEESPV